MIDGTTVPAIGVDGFPTPARESSGVVLEPHVLSGCGPCPGCPSAAILAAQEGRVVVCTECGASYEPEVAPEPTRATQQLPIPGNRQTGTSRAPGKRTRTHTLPTDPDKRIRTIVTELLAWHLASTQRDAIGGGSFAPIRQSSPTASACRVLETGVIGDGNSGTKGTWRGIAPEPGEAHTLAVDRQVGVRYWALGSDVRNIADAVIADANGDRVVDVELYAGKTLPLSLAQRIGLASASVNQQAKWRVKIAKRDSTPALEGMESLGRERLSLLADRWQELIEQERVEELRMEARAEVMRGVRMEVAFVSFDVLCARTAIRSQRVRVAATEAQR